MVLNHESHQLEFFEGSEALFGGVEVWGGGLQCGTQMLGTVLQHADAGDAGDAGSVSPASPAWTLPDCPDFVLHFREPPKGLAFRSPPVGQVSLGFGSSQVENLLEICTYR